ncbi:amino acid permease [Spiroplasma gladiatoris]|uniref:Amino acid permease n=1 Tax=Spiroplasma gladiatoris TaxID=2143 RepID=A0A4P7AGV6_9MOLU|nr:amino acid permease [Spiroplasma gladiatoris]QBQ07382.1 amino acid permease [Spiroplasma gladiatoris]
MLNINKKNKVKNKIFEFLTIFSMVIGLVVGSGIYLKNRSAEGGVLNAAKDNPYLAIIIWIFIGIVCTLMIVSFLEISSAIKKDQHNTLLSWSSKFISRRAASAFSIFYVTFYMPILAALGAVFTISVTFEYGLNPFLTAIGKSKLSEAFSNTSYNALKITLASIILIGFQLLNYFSEKPSQIIQTICTFTKFLPLIVVLIGGFVLYLTNNVADINGDPGGQNSFQSSSNQWKFWSFFATVVPVIFAFDGFIHAVTLQKDVEHKKVVEPALYAGILAITLFYILITIAIFIGANDGNIFKLFDNLFVKTPIISFLFKLIIAFTVATLCNGYTNLLPKTIQSAAHEGFLYFGKDSLNLSKKKASIIAILITLVLFYITIILSLSVNPLRDNTPPDYAFISETLSTSTVIYAFIIYYTLIVGVVHNRRTKKIETKKVKGGFTIGIINLVVLSLILPYVYFEYLIRPFITLNQDSMICAVASFIILIPIAIFYFVNEFKIKKSTVNDSKNKVV